MNILNVLVAGSFLGLILKYLLRTNRLIAKPLESKEIDMNGQNAQNDQQALMNSYELFRQHLSVYNEFQSSKETLAYGAATLYLIGATTLLIRTPFWLGLRPLQFLLLMVLLISSAVLGFLFVWWQLKQRRFAIVMFTACFNLSTRWLTVPPSRNDLTWVERKDGLFFPKALEDEFKRADRSISAGAKRFFDHIAYAVMVVWGGAAILNVLASWLEARCYF